MKKALNILFALMCTVLMLTSVQAQAQETVQHVSHESSAGHSVQGPRLTAIMGYSLINNSFIPESNDVLIVPTLGLNFDYYLTEKWGIGLHSDILLSQFKAEKHNGHEEIIRENPIAICAMGLFKVHERWAFLLGYGLEFEKHENLPLIRMGCEYGIPLPKHWEVALSLEYDYKINSYGALMFGIGFSRALKKKKNSL